MSNSTTTLEYAAPLAWHRRRWLQRTIVLSSVAAALAVAVALVVPPLWPQWQYLRIQSRCLNYSPPADQVVYEEDPQESARLLASESTAYHRLIYHGTLAGVDWNPICAIPQVIQEMARLNLPLPLLFVHARRDAAGRQYLVYTSITQQNAEELGRGRVVKLEAIALRPASLWPGSKVKMVGASNVLILSGLQPGERLRVYAGQVHAADDSRFTIEYRLNDQAGTITGKVQDGGAIELQAPHWSTAP